MKIILLTYIFFLATHLYGQAVTGAQPAPIPSSVQRSMETFLKALNSRDAGEIEKFVRETHHPEVVRQVPMPMLVARWMSVHQQSGPVEARIFKNLSPTASVVWTRGKLTKVWVGFQFIYEKDEPHRINVIARDSGPMPPPEEMLPRAKSPNELTSRMNSYLDALVGTPHFSGSILIAHKGRTILNRSLRNADIENKIPNSSKTVYNIASISKMFAAVAIAQLAEKSRLGYQDPVSKFIPTYPKSVAEKVTIHHLLTHTSGIELDEIPEFNQKAAAATSVKDLVDAQIEFLPKMEGIDNFKLPEKYDYTNEGYALLARIVEIAGEKNYYSYIEDHILKPLRMNGSGAFSNGSTLRYSAIGYTNRNANTGASMPGPPRIVRPWESSFRQPSGGLDSSTGDLLRFANGLFIGTLLKLEARQIVMKKHAQEAGNSFYGYGLMIRDTIAGTRYGHSGANMGFSSRLDYYPESGYTVIVLANQDQVANTMADMVMELIRR